MVGSIRSIGSHPDQPSGFADIGETVTLVASVTDAETPPDRLTYQWTGPGTFSGTGTRHVAGAGAIAADAVAGRPSR